MLGDKSVHTVVTSPPYFGLRDYDVSGQIGLESTPDEYVASLVDVFRSVRRVLRDDGVVWLVLGDSYAGSGKGGNPPDSPHQKQATNAGIIVNGMQHRKLDVVGLASKQLIGIPWRVAFALQADGWYLRQDIIWSKPNPMPESVRDRCTKAHEYIFMLTKSPRYYFDSEAIQEPAVKGYAGSSFNKGKTAVHQLNRCSDAERADGTTRNKRSVWSVAAKPFKGAHFATFPPYLIEPCILASTSEHGVCGACGSPYQRIVERKSMVIDRSDRNHALGDTRSSGTMVEPASSRTLGWKASCGCNASPVPAIVFDPFGGSGTTAVVALKHGRNAILSEMNLNYVIIAHDRIRAAR